MKLFNSLGREEQVFTPITESSVGMYTCGPTVYSYVTIGNWRTYTLGDLVYRTFKYLGYDVKYIMNITDVGHLTGDNEGDADTGIDRLEKASKREGKSAWEIAEFYADDFVEKFKMLNLIEPEKFTKATDHIEEQIKLVQELEEKGFAYKITDGIYFDVQAFEAAGNEYGELSNLDEIKEGARVSKNDEKKDPRDFALWKFSPEGEKRHMEWESPWGLGFPGWHIECSAMSMKYLGNHFDIHVGGEDLKSTHHPNEIAQSEGATGEPFVNYWLHGAFLLVDGGRMGKSLGNAYTLDDIVEKGFSPMDLRYFYLTGHYRKQLNFTWESLTAAKNAREKLVKKLSQFNESKSEGVVHEDYKQRFTVAIEDDLNMPKALAVLWDLVNDNSIDEADRLATALDIDQVLGLELESRQPKADSPQLTDKIQQLINERDAARTAKDWTRADEIRDRLKDEFGYEVQDGKAAK